MELQLEYIFKKPLFLATCTYGIMFIVLGNLAGNAVGLGIYVMTAARPQLLDKDDSNYPKGAIYGIAILGLTFASSVHIFSRRGGILMNNMFAVVKVGILVVIIFLGIIHSGGKYLQVSDDTIYQNITVGVDINGTSINHAPSINFNPATSFTHIHNFGNFIQAFIIVLYPYSGYEQPFYVLSEVKNARKIFPKYTLLAMVLVLVLFVLVNVSYLSVVPKQLYTSGSLENLDMATTFFHDLFDSNQKENATKAMSSLIAVSILGNLIVMTFTAARVKQEIAKEGIFPLKLSLILATGYTTPWAWLRSPRNSQNNQLDLSDTREKSPIAALGLHWTSSIFLVAVTAGMHPNEAYSFLISLYSFVFVALIGFFVSGGLLYLKVEPLIWRNVEHNWSDRPGGFKPWLDPLHAIIYFFFMGVLVFGAFVKSSEDSVKLKYWWAPCIGLTSPLWGIAWWIGLKMAEKKQKLNLHVERTPRIEQDRYGNHVQTLERTKIGWLPNTTRQNLSDTDSTTSSD
jgi:amino acid transporter